MAKIAEVQEVAVNSLKPYERNAKIHGKEQIDKLKASIEEFGFLTPCLIDRDYNIIAGHGRVMAAKSLGMETVPCVYIEGLTEAQRRAYILADNRLGELGEWDMYIVEDELFYLDDMDFAVELTGFEMPEKTDWFSKRQRDDDSRQEGNEEYNEFLDKFEQPKTTDDCYTPDIVYDAVADWVTEKYGIDREQMVRPFYPGGDYQRFKYPDGCVVVDNPPFSILSDIRRWYSEKGVKYFLFASTLICMSMKPCDCSVVVGCTITYENKASVNTSFATNMENNKAFITCPELYKRVQEAADSYADTFSKTMQKYSYPACVVSSAMLASLSKYGETFEVKNDDVAHISALDAQKEIGKTIFGGGFLISEKAAAEKAAAEKAAAEKAAAIVWKLSDREKEIVKSLGNHEKERDDG